MTNTLILHPFAHREHETRPLGIPFPLGEWRCGVCDAELDPTKPIPAVGSYGLCSTCAASHNPTDFAPCRCPACILGYFLPRSA